MSYYGGGNEANTSPVYVPHSRGSGTGASTPTGSGSSNSGFLSSSLYSAFGGIMRRLSSEPNGHLPTSPTQSASYHDRDIAHAATFPTTTTLPTSPTTPPARPRVSPSAQNGIDGVYTPPATTRTASPLLLRPPPLEPLTLRGFSPDTPASARLLTSTVAEEIRIMVPERLRIEEDWKLAYSLDQDGASLATLYEKAARYDEHRIGFVLVVKDQDGGVFGAYLTEYPRPSSHYFGTGECFLWRAAVLSPASAHYTAPTKNVGGDLLTPGDLLIPGDSAASSSTPSSTPSTQRPLSPSIRFSAFPYSGVNEYFIYCEAHSLSVGGGDGRYGLWLNDSLDKGISATCLTFGNQPLSDEGDKFGVLGVELWVIGSRR